MARRIFRPADTSPNRVNPNTLMTFLETLLLLPLVAILGAVMIAYASVSGNLRTREAEEREEKENAAKLQPPKEAS